MYFCFLLFNCSAKLTMKILFDYQAFYIQDAGGVSNSFAQLMRHLPSSTEVKLAMRESDNVHLQGQSFAQDVPPLSAQGRLI